MSEIQIQPEEDPKSKPDGKAERRKGKKWYKSKTVWFNAGMGILDFVNTNIGMLPVDPQTKFFVLLLGNTILRVATKDKLER